MRLGAVVVDAGGVVVDVGFGVAATGFGFEGAASGAGESAALAATGASSARPTRTDRGRLGRRGVTVSGYLRLSPAATPLGGVLPYLNRDTAGPALLLRARRYAAGERVPGR